MLTKKPRKKRPAKPVVALENPKEAVIGVVGDEPGGLTTHEICAALQTTPQILGDVFQALLESKKIVGFSGLWFSPAGFEAGCAKYLAALQFIHEKSPAKANLPPDRVAKAAGLKWSGKPLDRILEALAEKGMVLKGGASVRAPDFGVKPTPKQRRFLDSIIVVLSEQPVNTPNPHLISLAVNAPIQAVEEALKLGVQTGEILSLEEGVYYTRQQIETLKDRTQHLMGSRAFTAAELRDALGTTRKYIIPVLEHFDEVGFTRRNGDERKING